jgi:hypothetical protein
LQVGIWGKMPKQTGVAAILSLAHGAARILYRAGGCFWRTILAARRAGERLYCFSVFLALNRTIQGTYWSDDSVYANRDLVVDFPSSGNEN